MNKEERKKALDSVWQKSGKAIAALSAAAKTRATLNSQLQLPPGMGQCARCAVITLDPHKLGDADIYICRRCWDGVMEIVDDFPAELEA
jgi:hypothetical protein